MSDLQLYTYGAVVVRVVDGDTLILDIDLGCGVWLRGERCRLLGIDTPEPRGETKEEGQRATRYVQQLVETYGDQVVIQTAKDTKGKYGRWLVTVWLEDNGGQDSLNARLLKSGMAREMDA